MTGVNRQDLDAAIASPIGSVDLADGVKVGTQAYAVQVEGSCMAPMLNDGDVVICDPAQPPRSGDLVVVWFADGQGQPSLKRLVLDLPGRSVPGNVEALAVVVEQLNPPRFHTAPMRRLRAVHKVMFRQPK